MNAPSDRRTYDLYVRREGAGFAWKFTDPGVTLQNGRIGWTLDGERHETPLTDLAEVHLQTNMVGQASIAVCRLTFADGFVILVLSSSENGTYDADHAATYAAFVRDLHARLSALKGASIVYTAGYSSAGQTFGLVLLVIAALFFIALPTILLLKTRELSMLSALYFGVFLVWPLYRLLQTNPPAHYEPNTLPIDLIDT